MGKDGAGKLELKSSVQKERHNLILFAQLHWTYIVCSHVKFDCLPSINRRRGWRVVCCTLRSLLVKKEIVKCLIKDNSVAYWSIMPVIYLIIYVWSHSVFYGTFHVHWWQSNISFYFFFQKYHILSFKRIYTKNSHIYLKHPVFQFAWYCLYVP